MVFKSLQFPLSSKLQLEILMRYFMWCRYVFHYSFQSLFCNMLGVYVLVNWDHVWFWYFLGHILLPCSHHFSANDFRLIIPLPYRCINCHLDVATWILHRYSKPNTVKSHYLWPSINILFLLYFPVSMHGSNIHPCHFYFQVETQSPSLTSLLSPFFSAPRQSLTLVSSFLHLNHFVNQFISFYLSDKPP